MTHFLKLFCPLLFFFSCGQNQTKKLPSQSTTPTSCEYRFDELNTKVFWAGYKTTDKLKVVGQIKAFETNRTDAYFSSVDSMLNGLNFSLNTASSASGDEIRDSNLKDNFFNLLTDNFQINGHFSNVQKDSVTAYVAIFGLEKSIEFSHVLVDSVLKLRGTLSLDELGAVKAYQSIQNKCYDLHKGADGISKTWDDVDVLINVPISIKCR
ncbi:MAG: hypothetical protein P8I82_03425 [Flavobacteriales bacterium]|nr:hypothetical protein [Flavobacteriales bacterium]